MSAITRRTFWSLRRVLESDGVPPDYGYWVAYSDGPEEAICNRPEWETHATVEGARASVPDVEWKEPSAGSPPEVVAEGWTEIVIRPEPDMARVAAATVTMYERLAACGWLTTRQAAEYAHRDQAQLRREVHAGTLAAARTGRGGRTRLWFTRETLDRWLKDRDKCKQ